MRFPGFMQFTPEERRAVLAILLFTGGGGLLLEIGRRHPQWVPGLLAARRAAIASPAEGGRGRGAADSASAVPGTAGGTPPVALPIAGRPDSARAGGHRPAGMPDESPAAGSPAAPLHAAASLLPGRNEEAPAGEPDRPPPATRRKPPDAPGPGGALVDLNHAGPVELGTLPGIGPKLAQRIIEDRAARGPFRSLEDLARVKGIGKVTVARLHGLAAVGGR